MSQAYLLSVETEKTEHRSAGRWGPAVAGEKGETRVRVAVIMGGVSGEHDISLKSGRGVLANLDEAKYQGRSVVISKDGAWAADGAKPGSMLTVLQELTPEIDVAFLALHGPNGEDGSMQGLFHLLDIPYTGSDYYASSLAMNKPRTKDVYAAAGLTVAPHHMVYRDDQGHLEQMATRIMQDLGTPVVAKTTKLGSSVGIGFARDAATLADLLEEYLHFSGEVMVEQFVKATEVTASVIDNPKTGRAEALPLIEIRPEVSDWFDYRAKYEVGGALEICPAPISAEWTAECQRIGLLAHRILGCRGMSRTDILIDDAGSCYVVETNTIPGFTETSLLPQAAAQAGYSYSDLVDMLLQEALARSRG